MLRVRKVVAPHGVSSVDTGCPPAPPDVRARVSVEQASTFGWSRYVGMNGHSVGMRSFGASAPLKELQKKFGFTVENVIAAAREQIQRHGKKTG